MRHGEFQEQWWGDDRALVFLAVERARVLCECLHDPIPTPRLREASLSLGMAGYHLSDRMEPEFRHELIDAVESHVGDGPADRGERAEEALILATDAAEGVRDLLADEPDDAQALAGLDHLHAAVASLVREVGPRRAAALMLTVGESG